ncbi:hypothetical protein ACMA5I_10255 [Paracoccaceae bacterium GXU_MW_L88]
MTQTQKIKAYITGDIKAKQELYRQLDVTVAGSGEKILRILREAYAQGKIDIVIKK